MNPTYEPTYADLKEEIKALKQRLAEMGEVEIDLHAKIIKLESEAEGPEPYKTWQEAAVAERMKRMDLNKTIRELTARDQEAICLISRWLETDKKHDWAGFQKRVEKYLGVNQPEPIPKNVWFDTSMDEFYDAFYDFRTMGQEFRDKWYGRRLEFPPYVRNLVGTWP